MNIVSFGASYSRHSINKVFAGYAASLIPNGVVDHIDISQYDLPIYTIDREQEHGIPQAAHDFLERMLKGQLIIISLAEHNGTYTAAFKNLFDWISRINNKFFLDKNILLLSTAPGPRGGLGVMQAALTRFPIHGAHIAGHFSLPRFKENFDAHVGITNVELKAQFQEVIESTLENMMVTL